MSLTGSRLFNQIVGNAPAPAGIVTPSNPELCVMGYRHADGAYMYDVRIHQGMHQPLREWCSDQKISYQGFRKKINALPKDGNGLPSKQDWHDLVSRSRTKVAQKQMRQGREAAKQAQRVGANDRPDIGIGMRRAALQIFDAMQMAEEPLGRLPRKLKIAIVRVLKAGNDHPDFAMRGHGESETKARVTRDADRLIERYTDELERLAKRAEAAKRLGVENYSAGA